MVSLWRSKWWRCTSVNGRAGSSVSISCSGFVATGSLRGGIDVPEATTASMEVNAAVGFALAMAFAVLAVVAVQVYDA